MILGSQDAATTIRNEQEDRDAARRRAAARAGDRGGDDDEAPQRVEVSESFLAGIERLYGSGAVEIR